MNELCVLQKVLRVFISEIMTHSKTTTTTQHFHFNTAVSVNHMVSNDIKDGKLQSFAMQSKDLWVKTLAFYKEKMKLCVNAEKWHSCSPSLTHKAVGCHSFLPIMHAFAKPTLVQTPQHTVTQCPSLIYEELVTIYTFGFILKWMY